MNNDFPLDGEWGDMIRHLRALRTRLHGLARAYKYSDNLGSRVSDYLDATLPILNGASNIALANYNKTPPPWAPPVDPPPGAPPVDPAQERIPEMECYFEDG
jgi:hypothetical protein